MEQNTSQPAKEKTLDYFLDIVARETSFGRCNYGEFEKERLDVISNFKGDSKEIYYYEHFGLTKIELEANKRFHAYQIEHKYKQYQSAHHEYLLVRNNSREQEKEIQSLKEQLEEEKNKLNEIHVLNYLSKRLSAEGDLVEQWGEFFNESGFKISNEYLLQQFKQ